MRGHIHSNQMSIAYRSPWGERLGCAGDSAAVRGRGVQRTGAEGVGKQMGRRTMTWQELCNASHAVEQCLWPGSSQKLGSICTSPFERAFSLQLCCGWEAGIGSWTHWHPTPDCCSSQQRSITQQDVKKQIDCCLIIYISCFIIKTWSSTLFLKISEHVCNMTDFFSSFFFFFNISACHIHLKGSSWDTNKKDLGATCCLLHTEGALGNRVPIPW